MKKHNYSLIFGLILTGIILVITIIGQFWTPYDITGMNSMARNQAPSLMHIMGTDNFGRDVFSRVMNGCGTTFFVALSTVVIGCFLALSSVHSPDFTGVFWMRLLCESMMFYYHSRASCLF